MAEDLLILVCPTGRLVDLKNSEELVHLITSNQNIFEPDNFTPQGTPWKRIENVSFQRAESVLRFLELEQPKKTTRRKRIENGSRNSPGTSTTDPHMTRMN